MWSDLAEILLIHDFSDLSHSNAHIDTKLYTVGLIWLAWKLAYVVDGHDCRDKLHSILKGGTLGESLIT